MYYKEQYGMNSNGGGYSKQFENNMQKVVGKKVGIGEYFDRKAKLHLSMISGEDTNESRTTGVIPILKGIYECGINGITKSYLCKETDHYASDISDKGWGCGYRNLQMLLSSLLKVSPFKETIVHHTKINCVMSVPKLQSFIEKAWEDGYDVNGCEQLGGKLSGTKKWIGATEVAVFLRWLNVRARIVDFHQPEADKTHPLLFEWVENYFETNNKSETKNSFPLYLQHQGHSRLCIGVEEHSQGDCKRQLLLFDPSHSQRQVALLKNLKMPCNKTQTKNLRKSLKQMKYSQFQLVFIDGIYDNDKEREESKVLSAIRVSNGSL